MANSGKGTFQPESDVHISYDDQQKINIFARLNAKLEEYKAEVKVLQSDIKNLEDAIEELTLAEDSESIPYLIGEVFMCLSLEKALKSLDLSKSKKVKEIQELDTKCDDIKSQMSDLKAHLYGRFGNHINLENEEDD